MKAARESLFAQCLPQVLPLLTFLEERIRVPYLEGGLVDRYIAQPAKAWYCSKTDFPTRKKK
tara:strand:+ start:133 stop:318 length:186 start_codon:yes stop_codon:yes gene_type:complete